MAKVKGKAIYLTSDEQCTITTALNRLSKYHQEQYEEECRQYEADKYKDKYNIDDWHLDCMINIRDLVDKKFKLRD